MKMIAPNKWAPVLGACVIACTSFSAMAESERELYDRTVKIFTQPKISLIVDSDIHFSADSSEKRSFYLAKYEPEKSQRSLLIRFLEPSDIRCTAVLINSEDDAVKRYAYFPAIKRVRIIPDSEKGNEVFGIGISYEDLGEPEGDFLPVESVDLQGVSYYKLTLQNGAKKQVYFIDSTTEKFSAMDVYENDKILKHVAIGQVDSFGGEDLITAWKIEYPQTGKKIDFQVRTDSITDDFSESIFYKNRLKRCKLF